MAASLENALELLRGVIHAHAPDNTPAPTTAAVAPAQRVVVSLFDYTCIGLEPWRARAASRCTLMTGATLLATPPRLQASTSTASISAPMRGSLVF